MAPRFNGKPGDLIEISRWSCCKKRLYQHWAVHIGGDEVVHFGGQSSGKIASLSSRTGKVKRDKLADVVEDDHYQVNNLLDEEYEARDPSIIVKEACAMVGCVLPYNAVTYNCEHFATERRYGKAESRQATVGVISCVAGVARGAYAWSRGASVVAAGGTGLVVAVVVLGAFVLYRHLSCRYSSKEEKEDNKKIKITKPKLRQKWIRAFI